MTATTVYRDLLDRGFSIRRGDGDRLRLAPFSHLTEADKAAIVQHKSEILGILVWGSGDPAPDEERPAPRRIHDVPSGCLGPTACRHLGLCGRSSCVTPDESDAFAVAMATARRADNPHGVQRLTGQDISALAPSEEAA